MGVSRGHKDKSSQAQPSPVPIESSNVNMAAGTFGVSSSSRIHVTGSHLFHTNFLLVFQDVSLENYGNFSY